jgi:hypothetical protein
VEFAEDRAARAGCGLSGAGGGCDFGVDFGFHFDFNFGFDFGFDFESLGWGGLVGFGWLSGSETPSLVESRACRTRDGRRGRGVSDPAGGECGVGAECGRGDRQLAGQPRLAGGGDAAHFRLRGERERGGWRRDAGGWAPQRLQPRPCGGSVVAFTLSGVANGTGKRGLAAAVVAFSSQNVVNPTIRPPRVPIVEFRARAAFPDPRPTRGHRTHSQVRIALVISW